MAKRIPAAASDCDGMIGVIYARYSSHSQREESIEDQLRECHEFAARNNIKIIAEYTDSALTPATDMTAPYIRRSSERTASAFCMQKRRYRTDLRASSWSQFSRDMPSITARRFPRTSSEVWKAMP